MELANLRLGKSEDIRVRETQAALLKKKFLDELRRYQTVESEARNAYKARIERQYRIGKFKWLNFYHQDVNATNYQHTCIYYSKFCHNS